MILPLNLMMKMKTICMKNLKEFNLDPVLGLKMQMIMTGLVMKIKMETTMKS